MILDCSIGSAYAFGMSLELRHLRALAAVVELGTFGRAAHRLGYTQSTVSQQIAALETAVGGLVFDRPGGPRPVRLTPLGALILDRGRQLLRDADDLSGAIDKMHAGAGRVDIGTFQSVSTVILPSLVSRLRAEHPDCDVRLSEGEPEQPQIGDLDMLFRDGLIDDDVESVKLLDDPYVLVARSGQFPDEPVPLSELRGRAVVAWPATCDQPVMEQMMREGGAQPDIVFRSASNEALLSMVHFGLGCAVLPKLAVTGVDGMRGLRTYALDPAPYRPIYLHWPRRRAVSRLALRAIELARDIAADLST